MGTRDSKCSEVLNIEDSTKKMFKNDKINNKNQAFPLQGIFVEGKIDKDELAEPPPQESMAKGMTGLFGGFTARAAAHVFKPFLPPETNLHMMKKLIRASMVPRISSLLKEIRVK